MTLDFCKFRDKFFCNLDVKNIWSKEQVKRLFDDLFYETAEITAEIKGVKK